MTNGVIAVDGNITRNMAILSGCNLYCVRVVVHRVREKRVYGLLCITVTNVSIFSQFLAKITLILHYTKNI